MTIFFRHHSDWYKCKQKLIDFFNSDFYENMKLSEKDLETLNKDIYAITLLENQTILVNTVHNTYHRCFGSESTLYHLIWDVFGDQNAGIHYCYFKFQDDD